jgi:tRNA G18 (ribose-2'-O)-methylase SpoU
LEAERRFVVEGEKVVRRLLESRFPVESLLITEEWLARISDLLGTREDKIEVFRATKKQIEVITGFTCYQGIKAMSRIVQPDTLDSLLKRSSPPRLFVAMDELANAESWGKPHAVHS